MYNVTISNAVKEYLISLPKSEQLKGLKSIKMFEIMGHKLSFPYKRDIKGDKHLKELRTPTGTRIYYFYFNGKEYRCIWAGSKKTQEKDIKKAKQILAKIIGNSYA